MKLRTIVEKHHAAFGGNAGVATAIGMTNSGLLRGLKANRLSVEALIRLAHVCNEPGDVVLRLGGHAEMADLIRSVWGVTDTPNRLTPGDLEQDCAEVVQAVTRLKAKWLSRITAPPPRGATPDGKARKGELKAEPWFRGAR